MALLRVWDIRPFVEGGQRNVASFVGIAHNFEKNLLRCCWSADDALVSAGSADRFVNVWDAETGKIEHRLGGHHGSVNETSLHPTKNIVASGSSDKTVFIGYT